MAIDVIVTVVPLKEAVTGDPALLKAFAKALARDAAVVDEPYVSC